MSATLPPLSRHAVAMRRCCLLLIAMMCHLALTAQSYDALWRRVQQQEQQGKPQSAYAIVQAILHKATAEGQRGQQLSATMRAIGLRQEWAPDSFFADIPRLEQERAKQTEPEARAIYASILAEVYEANRYRSQATGMTLTAESMQEWTREQYDSAAHACWQASLKDVHALADASTKVWLPFVETGAASATFNHDLLHLLWQRAIQQHHPTWLATDRELLEAGTAIADEYGRRGNADAQMLVWTDMVEAMPAIVADSLTRRLGRQLPTTAYEADDATRCLLLLKEAYKERPIVVEAYLRLLGRNVPDSTKVALANEAISLHPRYARTAAVHNVLTSLRQPHVSLSGSNVYYPGKEYRLPLSFRNATSVTVKVYSLPATFSEDAMQQSSQKPAEYIARHGRLVQTLRQELRATDAYAETADSIAWQAPQAGRYALVYTATTSEQQATQRTLPPSYRFCYVSAIQPLLRSLPDGSIDVIAADAETGHPLPGVEVTLFRVDYSHDGHQRIAAGHTDEHGHLRFAPQAGSRHSRYTLRFALATDCWLPESNLWGSHWQPSADRSTVLRLYTDRAIYRPGQTVHISGIAYEQDHWDAHTVAGTEVELTLRDVNGKEVARQQVSADSLGVIEAQFTLPAGGLTGIYTVRSAKTTVSFRVEEYKRPTFEVTTDEAPAIRWPQDSITVSGRAMGYNGVPVRGGRVAATYQFTYPYRWLSFRNDSPVTEADTVETDTDGCYSLCIPLTTLTDEVMRSGLVMRVQVAVTSPAGETREAVHAVPLCSTPLRFTLSINELQDRERPKSPQFSLLSSTGQPAQATVSWSIVADRQEAGNAPTKPIASGKFEQTGKELDAMFERVISSLPTGSYTLCAMATAGADSARAEGRFCTFAMNDKQVPRQTRLWLYCPADTFAADGTARLLVGTSLTDAVIYCSLVGSDGSVADSLMHVSGELRTITIPYTDSYGDGITAHFAIVHDGQVEVARQALRRPLPDTQLRWEWTSFRDKLRPGQQETWTLRLTRPDGTPADANLMAAIYDASLDPLEPHVWQLLVGRHHRLNWLSWTHQDYYRIGTASMPLYFGTKSRRVPALTYDAIAPRWLAGTAFGSVEQVMLASAGPRRMFSRAKGGAVAEDAMDDAVYYSVENTSAMPTAANMDAGSDEAEAAAEDAATSTETATEAAAYVRSGFNETAAFMPRLHTDTATGAVSLTFTLPESLTTWRMLGIAHTQDMLTASITAEAITQRELMAQLHLPRFLRAGDQGTIRATVQNLTQTPLAGKAHLYIIDPETQRVLLHQQADFTTDADGDTSLCFAYTPQKDVPIVVVRLSAESTQGKGRRKVTIADGEQRYLPILPAEEWVTESIEIRADSTGTFTTDLTPLFNHDSSSATQRRLTIDYTTHPIWTVVQALPSLRQPERDDVLSLTTAFYAHTLAAHIAATTPRLRDMVALWQQQAAGGQADALKSPLATAVELAQIALDETPWLRDATTDSERRALLCDLFDSSLVATRLQQSVAKLAERQQADGGFAWFPAMPSSTYMTSIVALHLSRLQQLTAGYAHLDRDVQRQAHAVMLRALAYVAADMHRTIEQLQRQEKQGTKVSTASETYLSYVYTAQHAGIGLTRQQQTDIAYLLNHLAGNVGTMTNTERALAAIVLKAAGRNSEAMTYYTSMLEHLTTTSAHGTYFDYAGGSFTPTAHKVARHALAMEAVSTVDAKASCFSGMRRWLLQQKRTQMWETSAATIDAIYALLTTSHAELRQTAADRITIDYGNRRKVAVTATPSRSGTAVTPDQQLAGLGHVSATYTDGRAPRAITVVRSNEGEAWGAVYAQYLTPVAAATAHGEGLTVRTQLSAHNVRVGDRLTTRYIITADRDYDYVCLRASRAACAEPSGVRSGYRYQGGLAYYVAVRDAHTDYFIEHLPKGTYVLEETAYVDREGTYTTGLTRLHCVYAPDFGATTAADTVESRE